MEIGDRLKLFLEENYESFSAFMYDVRTAQSVLYKYIRNESIPGGGFLQRLFDLGCNINWLLSGHGEMWNDTEAGQVLRKKHESELLVQTETGIDKKKKK